MPLLIEVKSPMQVCPGSISTREAAITGSAELATVSWKNAGGHRQGPVRVVIPVCEVPRQRSADC